MVEDQTVEGESTQERHEHDAWRDVGAQFEALGERLSNALRSTWESEETQQRVRSMQEGLESAVTELDRAVKQTYESEQAKKARTEVQKAVVSLREAGEKTWQEARPQVLSALTMINSEIQKLIDRLEQQPASGDDASDGDPSSDPGD